MHFEYAMAWPPGDAELLCEPLEPDAELAEALLEEVLDPRCATVGVFAPPPHPAASNASAANPAIDLVAFISSPPHAGLICLEAGSTRSPVTSR
jgi:hypothetical protein